MGTVDEWEKEWRESVSRNVRESSELLQTTVVAVKALETSVRELMEWRKTVDARPEAHDMRLNRWAFFAVSLCSLLVSLACGGGALIWDIVRAVTGH